MSHKKHPALRLYVHTATLASLFHLRICLRRRHAIHLTLVCVRRVVAMGYMSIVVQQGGLLAAKEEIRDLCRTQMMFCKYKHTSAIDNAYG